MSVWVCRFSQALEYALPLPCHYVDGANRCKKDNGPCDAVEYAEVKRGKWDGSFNDAMTEINRYFCTRCSLFVTQKTDYCPSCGAKMEASDGK